MSDRGAIDLDEMRAIDPSTPAGELAAIAYRSPGLRAKVAAHPNAYDDLRTWIAEFGSDPTPAGGPTPSGDSTPDSDHGLDAVAETVTAKRVDRPVARPVDQVIEQVVEPVVQTVQRPVPATRATPASPEAPPAAKARPVPAPRAPRPPRPAKTPRVRNPDPSPLGDAAAAISAAWKRARRDGEGKP